MSNIAKLREHLYGASGLGATNFKLYPGTDRNASAEQVAGEILRVLESQDFEEDMEVSCQAP